jgi:HEAT repeat protein
VLAGLVGLLLALRLLLWGAYAALALFHQEHFYHGLPSSHWERSAKACFSPGHAMPQWVPGFAVSAVRFFGLAGKPPVLEGDPAALSVIDDLLRSDDARVRQWAADAFCGMGSAGSAAARGLLVATTLDPVPEQRRGWDYDAAMTAHFALQGMDHAAVPVLLDGLAQQEDARLRREAAIALLGQAPLPPDTLPVLGEALRDRDANVRRNILCTLCRIDGWGAAISAQVLELALRDPDPTVRWLALGGFCTVGNETFPAFHPEVKRPPLPRRTLPAEPRTLALLAETLASPDARTRVAAVRALRNMGPAARCPGAVEVVPTLLQASHDAEEQVRAAAAEALWAVAPEAARKAGVKPPPPQEDQP